MSMTSKGERMEAARIVAGVVIAADAAKLLGISKVAIHRAEAGISEPAGDFRGRFCELFEVTRDYIETGAIQGEREKLAERVAALLASTAEPAEIDIALARRLKTARIESGHATAAAAINRFGFKMATYLSHEGGTRRLPLERAIYYALNFRVRPEFLLLGEMPVLAGDDDPVSRWTPASIDTSSSIHPANLNLNWRWLRKAGTTASLVLPILGLKEGKMILAEKDPMHVPKGLLPTSARQVDGPAYAIRISPEEIWIIDPSSRKGEAVLASVHGFTKDKSIEVGPGPDVLAQPELHRNATTLGLYIARIVIPLN